MVSGKLRNSWKASLKQMQAGWSFEVLVWLYATEQLCREYPPKGAIATYPDFIGLTGVPSASVQKEKERQFCKACLLARRARLGGGLPVGSAPSLPKVLAARGGSHQIPQGHPV